MNNDNIDTERQHPGDGLDKEPQWPQRPVPSDSSPRYGYRVAPTPQPDPTSQARRSADETKETQLLPIVEPSRFDRGTTRPQPPQPTPPKQAASKVQQTPPPAPPTAQPGMQQP